MRKILSLITLLTITSHLFSQIDTTKVAFVSYWSVGDSYDFKITKSVQQWKESMLTKDENHEYVANFTVIDSTETSYTINWSYENYLGETFDISDELMDKLSKYELTEVKYKTSEVGDFLELLNWEEVGEIMIDMYDAIMEVASEKDAKKGENLKTAMQPLKEIYGSKEGVEQLVLKEIQYFHFPLGLEYDITEPFYYDEELPNIFGGKPIKAKAKIYFEDVDFEMGFCVLKQEMSLDPDDTKEMLKQVFKQMNLGDAEMKKALKTATFQIEDRNVFEFYYDPGIPHRIEIVRETNIDMGNEKGKKIDRTLIELVYDE